MDYKLPKGYIDLIEKKYNLKVLDNHYILVDKNFQRYNTVSYTHLTLPTNREV